MLWVGESNRLIGERECCHQLTATNLSPPASPRCWKGFIKCCAAPKGTELTEGEGLPCSFDGTAPVPLWGGRHWTWSCSSLPTPAWQDQPGSPGTVGEAASPALSREGARPSISRTCSGSKTQAEQGLLQPSWCLLAWRPRRQSPKFPNQLKMEYYFG